MPSFCAGFIRNGEIKNSVAHSVYYRVKTELDTLAVKVSAMKAKGGINYIAFLSKVKISREDVLLEVEKTTKKSVIAFEIEYKKVGVLCEEGRVLDYILDNAPLYAKSHNLPCIMVNNTKGNKLYLHNITADKKNSKYQFATYSFLVVCILLVGLTFFYYTTELDTKNTQRQSLETQYKALVKENFDKAKTQIASIQFVEKLNRIEEVCYHNNININKVYMMDQKVCMSLSSKLKAEHLDIFKFVKSNEDEVIYCSEKI